MSARIQVTEERQLERQEDIRFDAHPSGTLSQFDLDRWKAAACVLPLPEHQTPLSGAPLVSVSDEDLLSAPPHMITHIQRTAAQGGLQVVSPRQIPFSALMVRRGGTERWLGDHDVGSRADRKPHWPTLDNRSHEHLLPDEPIAPRRVALAPKQKTRTMPLAKYAPDIADPVIGCLIKGRAVVDILRRDDIAGAADNFASLLAEAWDIPYEDLMELEAYTLGIDGDLQRHAMRSDDVYPVLYAPTQYRETIVTGTSELDKSILPMHTAMDWRRYRIFAEAVFYNTIMVQGVPICELPQMVCAGDPVGKPNKPGSLTFYPAPCTAWTFDPKTFCLTPDPSCGHKPRFVIPKAVREAITRYASVIKPVTYLLGSNNKMALWSSRAYAPALPPGETISTGYANMMKMITVGSARGKLAASAVRNFMFQSIEQAPPSLQARFARYVAILQNECKIHFKLDMVPDTVVVIVAKRFLQIGSYIHKKVAAEANVRGSDMDSWWEDIASQVPDRLASVGNSTLGWTIAAFWLLYREPTSKWSKLRTAITRTAEREIITKSVNAVAICPTIGSPQRLRDVGDKVVKEMSKTFYGRYMAVSDIAHALSVYADEIKRPQFALVLKEAAYLWELRASVHRAINVDLVPKGAGKPSGNHLRVKGEPLDLLLKPAPYKKFAGWSKHMENSTVIPVRIKRQFQCADLGETQGRVMGIFKQIKGPICVAPSSDVTRYLLTPPLLSAQVEQGWKDLLDDLARAINILVITPMVKTPVVVDDPGPQTPTLASPIFDLGLDNQGPNKAPEGMRTFHDLMAELEYDEVEVIEDILIGLPESQVDMIQEGFYTDLEELMELIHGTEASYKTEVRMVHETTR